jgi:type II secretory pathway pseudopilin PulG
MGGARRERGFTYIAILLAVALHGAVLAAVGVVWSNAQKREREAQLLFVGNEFRKAIRSYASSGGGAGTLPESLEDLLRDPRTPALKRHLRRIYADPMTGKAEWGLVRSPEGKGIIGVYSLSEEPPLKTGNFTEADKEFEGKASYAEWKFSFRPVQAPKTQPGAPGAPGAPPTAPGTLPPGLQMQPQPAAAPLAPGAAPPPALQPTPESQPLPVLQPTQAPRPAPAPQPAPAQQPAPGEAPQDVPGESAPAGAPQLTQPAPPQPAPAPAQPESPYTPGVLTPFTPSPVFSPEPAPAPAAPEPAGPTPAPAPVSPAPGDSPAPAPSQ